MADIHIARAHSMSRTQARHSARLWAEKTSQKFDMQCDYEEGEAVDLLTFKRSGVSGTLTVTGELFELKAKLGFMLSPFKERIEAEIARSLDGLIATDSAAQPGSSRAA